MITKSETITTTKTIEVSHGDLFAQFFGDVPVGSGTGLHLKTDGTLELSVTPPHGVKKEISVSADQLATGLHIAPATGAAVNVTLAGSHLHGGRHLAVTVTTVEAYDFNLGDNS